MVIVVKKIYKVIFVFLPYIYIIFHLIKCYFYGFEIVMMSGLDIPLSYGVEAMELAMVSFLVSYPWYYYIANIISLYFLSDCIFKKCLRKK